MVGEQAGHHAAPAVGGVAVAVDQDDRRAVAGVVEEGRDPVDVELAVRKLLASRIV
jgi:hypothetical protein